MTPSSAASPRRWWRRPGAVAAVVVAVATWAVVSVVVGVLLFLASSRETVIAGHDAVVSPTFDPYAVIRPGALLPDVRVPVDSRVGVDVELGKTEVGSTDELVQRYAFIASQPEGQVEKVTGLVTDMALSAALRGVVLGAVPVALWLLLGPARRRQLLRGAASWRGVAVVAAGATGVVLLVQPWDPETTTTAQTQDEVGTWQGLGDFLGAAVPLPEEARAVEVRQDAVTAQTRRLVESAISTYEGSLEFYSAAAEAAADLEVRQPQEDETVVVLVTDRHDNIGMDPVARAIADAGGATAVFDAGDDTSTGQPWEAFSLDSLQSAFGDLERYSITGNHDNGDFVGDYLADAGWERPVDGEVVEGPGGATLLGVDDPRSSGLGNWRDETGLSFGEVRDLVTEAACDADERVATLLVHDAALGRDALAEGCVDLVVGGHIHVRSGPSAVEGENGEVGYTYTSGTTGGAAYAIAVGSKPRRPAETTLITYRDGRPVGLQWVVLQTNGRFDVGEYVELDYAPTTTGADGEPTDVPTTAPEQPAAPEDTAGPTDDGAPADEGAPADDGGPTG
ncbi:metallophosphoesterase [Nocardioides sp. CPCC 205120]|uniref:metallophosphoesterase n=1 Tax=Nocardioides sp. CPCC 205120 TaxID=3406462 RepID=UPI003B50F285